MPVPQLSSPRRPLQSHHEAGRAGSAAWRGILHGDGSIEVAHRRCARGIEDAGPTVRSPSLPTPQNTPLALRTANNAGCCGPRYAGLSRNFPPDSAPRESIFRLLQGPVDFLPASALPAGNPSDSSHRPNSHHRSRRPYRGLCRYRITRHCGRPRYHTTPRRALLRRPDRRRFLRPRAFCRPRGLRPRRPRHPRKRGNRRIRRLRLR